MTSASTNSSGETATPRGRDHVSGQRIDFILGEAAVDVTPSQREEFELLHLIQEGVDQFRSGFQFSFASRTRAGRTICRVPTTIAGHRQSTARLWPFPR